MVSFLLGQSQGPGWTWEQVRPEAELPAGKGAGAKSRLCGRMETLPSDQGLPGSKGVKSLVSSRPQPKIPTLLTV